jgi:ABC-type iron transport system FetAB ATPase subunit
MPGERCGGVPSKAIRPSETAYFLHPARQQGPLLTEPFHHWNTRSGAVWLTFSRPSSHSYLLRFEGYADFLIDVETSEVQAIPTPETDRTTIEHLYLNQVLPLLLSHSGHLVLHGSAVVVQGAAVAFLGFSGAGKSTLATSLALMGHPFLTDDGLLLDRSEGRKGYSVLPSHPTVRLWEDSRLTLLGKTATNILPVQYNSKARIVASSTMPYCDRPQELRAIYMLGLEDMEACNDQTVGHCKQKDILIRRLAPAEALIVLVKNSFVLDIKAQAFIAHHFDQFTKLATNVPCFHLHYPRRYEALPSVQKALEGHCVDLAKTAP